MPDLYDQDATVPLPEQLTAEELDATVYRLTLAVADAGVLIHDGTRQLLALQADQGRAINRLQAFRAEVARRHLKGSSDA